MIRLKRATGWADKVRAYKVFIDGHVIGEIKDGEVKEFDCPEGLHEIYLKIDWCSTKPVSFVSDGSVLNFKCGSNLRGWKMLLGPIYAIFLRDQYIWISKRS